MGNKLQKKKISLTDQDVMMLQLTTSLERKEILKWHENFRKECKNGELNKKNFARFYKELMPSHPNADKFSEFVFEAFDKDHSGKVDFNEFLLSFSLSSNGNLEERLDWAFSIYDLDKNDFIDKMEMTKVLNAIFRFMNVQPSESPISPQMRVDEIFKQMDTNHDFKISRDEFIKCLLNDEFLRYLLAPV